MSPRRVPPLRRTWHPVVRATLGVTVDRQAWLLMAVGDNRQHGGNDGYDDEPDAHYSWDSTVGNHAAVQVGDPVVLWDKSTSLGVSVVEAIETDTAQKMVYRCRECGQAGIKARKSLTPRYKCFKCKAEFDEPTILVQPVTTYRSRHDAAWVDLDGVFTGAELRQLCVSPKAQLSIRPLRWDAFTAALVGKGQQAPGTEVAQVEDRAASLKGGHVEVRARARLGQGDFRKRLLSRYGNTCAITGQAPAEVLEAAHLYSYAEVGQHDEHGGLLLRRDIHRLFDRGALAVDPESLVVSVDESLSAYREYARLEGEGLQVETSASQRKWLARHWQQHRVATAPAAS